MTVMSTWLLFQRTEFDSQDPHDSLQLPVTLIPGFLTPSHRHTGRQNTNAGKINIKKEKDKPAGHGGTHLLTPAWSTKPWLH